MPHSIRPQFKVGQRLCLKPKVYTVFYPFRGLPKIPNSIPICHYHSKHHFFFFPAGSYDPSSTTGSPFTNTSPVLNYTQKQKFFLVPCNQWGWSCLQNPQWPTKCSVSVLVAGWARCNNLSNTCEGVPLHDPHNWSPRNFTKLNGPWNLLNLFLIYYYANIHK